MLATVNEVPVSQNASAGELVMFSCATNNSQEVITWSTVPHVEDSNIKEMIDLPAGGRRYVITILAEHDTNVKCIATNINTAVSTIKNAHLLVQGNYNNV